MKLNKQHNRIIDETISEIKDKNTINFHTVNGKEIVVKGKDRTFISDNTFTFFEIKNVELKGNTVFVTFGLLL
jgi:hypothetical protein